MSRLQGRAHISAHPPFSCMRIILADVTLSCAEDVNVNVNVNVSVSVNVDVDVNVNVN